MSNYTEAQQAELYEINREASEYYQMEQAVKLVLNSIYGAFGNPYFYFFNIDIAETITLQGKDAILYTESLLNKYFKDYWHKDLVAHKEMGITVTGKIEKPVCIYIDTDSCYVQFEEVIAKSEGWVGDEKEFILKLYKSRVNGYLEKILQRYADDNNSENFLALTINSLVISPISTSYNFKLPLISYSCNIDINELSSFLSFLFCIGDCAEALSCAYLNTDSCKCTNET